MKVKSVRHFTHVFLYCQITTFHNFLPIAVFFFVKFVFLEKVIELVFFLQIRETTFKTSISAISSTNIQTRWGNTIKCTYTNPWQTGPQAGLLRQTYFIGKSVCLPGPAKTPKLLYQCSNFASVRILRALKLMQIS